MVIIPIDEKIVIAEYNASRKRELQKLIKPAAAFLINHLIMTFLALRWEDSMMLKKEKSYPNILAFTMP